MLRDQAPPRAANPLAFAIQYGCGNSTAKVAARPSDVTRIVSASGVSVNEK